MKVKLLVSRSGADFTQNAGDVVDVSEAEAQRMFKAGQAEPVKAVETAAKKAEPVKRAKK